MKTKIICSGVVATLIFAICYISVYNALVSSGREVTEISRLAFSGIFASLMGAIVWLSIPKEG